MGGGLLVVIEEGGGWRLYVACPLTFLVQASEGGGGDQGCGLGGSGAGNQQGGGGAGGWLELVLRIFCLGSKIAHSIHTAPLESRGKGGGGCMARHRWGRGNKKREICFVLCGQRCEREGREKRGGGVLPGNSEVIGRGRNKKTGMARARRA